MYDWHCQTNEVRAHEASCRHADQRRRPVRTSRRRSLSAYRWPKIMIQLLPSVVTAIAFKAHFPSSCR
jgi:hypothetical protein